MTSDERKELEDYYGEMLMMMKSTGWGYFIRDIKDTIDNINLDNINTVEELHQLKGRITAGKNILALEQNIEFARDQLDEDFS